VLLRGRVPLSLPLSPSLSISIFISLSIQFNLFVNVPHAAMGLLMIRVGIQFIHKSFRIGRGAGGAFCNAAEVHAGPHRMLR